MRWDKNSVLKLRQYVDQGISQKEIAKLMGVSADTIKRAVSRLKDGSLGQPRNKPRPKLKRSHGNPFAMRFAPAKPRPSHTSDGDRIADFLAHHDVRHFEPGASGDIHNVMAWLDYTFGIKAKRVVRKGAIFVKEPHRKERRMTVDDFYAYVDRKRAGLGLKPLAADRSAAREAA